jgi:hypothetical protein
MASLDEALLQECKVIVTQGSSTISTLVDAAKKGKWTSADTTSLTNLIQPLISYLAGYNSVGIIASGGISFGVGVEEVPGVVLNTQDLSAAPYFYNFIGGSFGFSEGVEAGVGILIAQGTPNTLSGLQAFVDAGVTLVGGVGVQYSAGGQWYIFVSTGEDVNISVGAGDVSVKQL